MPPEDMYDKGLPIDALAEKMVLGLIMMDNEVFFDDAADLVAEDFALSSNRAIFRCINDILFGTVEDVSKVDTITLIDLLDKRSELKMVGDRAYIFHLTEDTDKLQNASEYVRIIKEKARLRRLGEIVSKALRDVSAQELPATLIMAETQNRLLEESAGGESGAVKAGDVTEAVRERIEKGRNAASGEERAALGLTWGIAGLDKFTKGAHLGEVTVAAGESGGGKTIFATQVVIANAREGTPCCIFSLEMAKEKLVQRFYPQMSESHITADMMRDPRLINLHTHIPEIEALSQELQRLPIWIDDSVSLHINTLTARVRMMRRKHGIKLFVIDYLQLIVNDAKTEAESIKGVMFKLRDLVKLEPDIHILLLSQFSKADGFSKKRRRSRNDLMGSSAIHHAAQNVLIITIEEDEEKDGPYLLDAEFRFDKQRDGKKGKVVCSFDRDHLRYRHAEPPMRF